MLSLSWACQLGSCPSAHLRRSEHFQSIRRRSEAHCPGLPTCLRCCWRPSSHRLPAQPSLAGWPPSPQLAVRILPAGRGKDEEGKAVCLSLPPPLKNFPRSLNCDFWMHLCGPALSTCKGGLFWLSVLLCSTEKYASKE